MTKYYQAYGRAVAMREPPGPSGVPSAGGAGTLLWLLADHLGGTVGVMDANGTVVATQAYWPYGATRSGGVSQTDKLYTGQQEEPGDAALGLYHYKARLYSTTVGRFVSADPLTKDELNRYAYVRANPVRFVDPSGLYLMLECGWTQSCDDGSIGQWRNFVIAYWTSGRSRVSFGHDRAHLDFVFDLLTAALSLRNQFSAADIVNTFDVFALDSSHSYRETDARRSASNLATAAAWLKVATNQDITYLAGFSWGAVTVYEYLYGVSVGKYYGVAPLGVYLVGGPNVFDLRWPIKSSGGIFQTDAPSDFDIGATLQARVVARSAPLEHLELGVPGIPWLTVNIAGFVGEVSGGADLRGPLGNCHCVNGLASFLDAEDLFR